jgi:hypothetical protein
MTVTVKNAQSKNLQIGPTIVTRGLVSCWDAASVYSYPRTGDTWYDLVKQNTNNGSLYNMSSANFSEDGVGSLILDGTDDYIAIPNDTSLNADTGDSFSVTAWIKPSADVFTSTYIVGKRGLGSTVLPGWCVQINRVSMATHQWQFVDVAIMDSAGKSRTFPRSTDTYSLNEWHHIALTYENNQTVSLYGNGELAMSQGVAGMGSLSNSLPLEIGATYYWNGSYLVLMRPLAGSISSVHYYNIGLGIEEVRQNYNAAKSRFVVEA